ncbi:ribosome-binding factor A [candidate division Kazan bacterium RIFCSPHIGHO2_01_FULL_49_10]|uniref:Ribosome-binding factor A n=1 Tax=candidate division Kazan bacterium RIFCSPLOWO2_01_FULL_48_13 TaxID=1798539 RepID=A0A1F4PNV3_UNCK3|nr:MAG: ribosome-binding factor A [candidate division Kazan bacterium RIFCSPHIGHO2_01_FULL_49_10]OGB85523.1 MAG: ribosome-binding factor A [candidate division Kazan bacterium RIFCSPLOWO2_01_FULL_48_13]
MGHRVARIQSEIERILGEFFLKEGRGFGIGMVSVNGILVSSDLASAKVLVSFIGEQHPEAAFKKLIKHGRDVQTFIFRRLQIRKVPKLIFELDKDPAGAYRVDQLLDDIDRSKTKDPNI